MIAVSLNIGGDVQLIKPAKLCTCTQKHYKHNEGGRTAPDVCGNGSVPLSHSGRVVTRIGKHMFVKVGRTHRAPYRGYGYVPLRFGGNVVRRMGTQQQQVSKSFVALREIQCVITITYLPDFLGDERIE